MRASSADSSSIASEIRSLVLPPCWKYVRWKSEMVSGPGVLTGGCAFRIVYNSRKPNTRLRTIMPMPIPTKNTRSVS